MQPYQPDYDAYSSNQEQGYQDGMLHDIRECHRKVERNRMTHDNTCTCCGKTLAFIGIQRYPARLNRPDETLVHCTNLDCAMFERTTTDHYHAQACAEERERHERQT